MGWSAPTLHRSCAPKCAACSAKNDQHCSGRAEQGDALKLVGGGTQRVPALDPPLEFAHDNIANDRHASLAIIEARNRSKVFTACMAENFRVLHGDLFQSLKAVGGKSGSDNRKVFHPALCERLDGRVSIRLEPFSRAKPRLEGNDQPLIVELELLAKERRRLGAVAGIRVAFWDSSPPDYMS